MLNLPDPLQLHLSDIENARQEALLVAEVLDNAHGRDHFEDFGGTLVGPFHTGLQDPKLYG